MRRLFFLLIVFCYYGIAIAQHPHSKGGSPFYWALVGGIGVVLYYAIFKGIPLILSLLKKRKKKDIENEIIVESRVIESKESETNATNENNQNNQNETLQPVKSLKNDAKNDSSSNNSTSRRSKKQIIISSVIFLLLSILSIILIENHIYNKKEQLSLEIEQHVMSSFNSNELWNSRYVDALSYNNIEDLEYEEIPIPDFPNNGDKVEKKYWTNKFSKVEHLYKLTCPGWIMRSLCYHRDNVNYYNDDSFSILQSYTYFPYLIGVPKGVDFNIQIAQAIVNRALSSFYKEPDEFEAVQNSLAYSNEYYHIYIHSLDEREPGYNMINYYDQHIGGDPIYEEGKFTGYYWYTMQRLGPYRILYAYRNSEQMVVSELNGFSASKKDRILYYGLTFLLLILLFVLYLYKDRIKLKPQRMFHKEKSDNQMYCKHCGKLVDSDSEFCKYCGKNL